MSPVSVGLRCAAIVGLSMLAGACKESTAPPTPASVNVAPGAVAEGVAGTVLTTPPTFEVKDAAGNTISGAHVTIAITAGGGTLTDAPTSTKTGATPIGTWKLGNVAGINSVTVTVGSLPPLVITVNGKAGPPASLAFVTGSGQSTRAGTAVLVPPVAQVRDQFGNGVPATPVTFSVADGDGQVSNTPVSTDASGNATSPAWTLGKSAVPQGLRASTTGGFGAVATATVASDYTVDVRFFGPAMPPVTAGMFTAAAARIRGSVIGDVIDIAPFVPAVNLETGCGVTGLPTAFSEPVDDVIIYASVGAIDGVGKVLAFAGPCGIRGNSGSVGRQTFIGVMKFDVDDLESLLARGNLTDVIQHEMLHVVGIGTLWSTYGLILDAGTPQTRFVGALGVGACVTIAAPVCPGSVPVENTGGPGTADGHWREQTFGNELMTGFVTSPTPGFTGILNPFSTISIQSLADLGYVVNPSGADLYNVPGQSASRMLGAQLNVDTSSPWETVVRPKLQISPRGQLQLIPQQ
jgi:hypothetical protein